LGGGETLEITYLNTGWQAAICGQQSLQTTISLVFTANDAALF
jgi:hypothetical protein